MYLKLCIPSLEHVRNSFGKIKYDLEPISWQEKRTLEVQKIYEKTQSPQKFIFPLPLGRPFPAMKLVRDHILSFQNYSQHVPEIM